MLIQLKQYGVTERPIAVDPTMVVAVKPLDDGTGTQIMFHGQSNLANTYVTEAFETVLEKINNAL